MSKSTENKIQMSQKLAEAILGLAVGDAVGVPVEFTQPHILEKTPVTDMCGGGSHAQPIGTWSDDTSMTLALMDALSTGGKEIDYVQIMKNFFEWLNNAKYTSGDKVFDVGKTCFDSIIACAKGNFSNPLGCGRKFIPDILSATVISPGTKIMRLNNTPTDLRESVKLSS